MYMSYLKDIYGIYMEYTTVKVKTKWGYMPASQQTGVFHLFSAWVSYTRAVIQVDLHFKM